MQQHNGKIADPQAHRHRDVEELLENQRRNIHASCGGSRPDDHPKGNPQPHAAKEGTEQKIMGDYSISQGLLAQPQKYRV